VDERLRFIAAVKEDPKGNFTRLCARFGISRAKGYKWVARYSELGPAGLEDRTSRPRGCSHRTPDAMTDRIVAERKKHPFDGPKKLRQRLVDAGVECVPAASTIGEILDRFGLIRPRRARIRVPPSSEPLAHARAANDVWCTDFKGHFACESRRCHPLTITDAASRFLIKREALPDEKDGPVREHFELAFREFGIPTRIRSDNGGPFATKALGGLSRLSVWWIKLGIVPERIEPGEPQQNGRHERFHRTLKEQTANPPATTFADQQRAFDTFRADYNNERPHEALGMKTPASHYEPSLRSMPAMLREPEYPSDVVVRRVAPNGYFSWDAELLRAGHLLEREPVGLKEIDDGEWELFYGPILLGYVLTREGKPRIERLG
jgi:transposase InsO family protein